VPSGALVAAALGPYVRPAPAPARWDRVPGQKLAKRPVRDSGSGSCQTGRLNRAVSPVACTSTDQAGQLPARSEPTPEASNEKGSATEALAERARKRAVLASDEFTPEAFASLIDDPRMRSAALDAKRGPVRPRSLDDSEQRFALLELDAPKKGGGS
jgi:hypothetical protein